LKRPTTKKRLATVTTPLSATMIELLGPGLASGGIVLTRSESQAIEDLYGYKKEEPSKRPPEPTPPTPPGPSSGPDDARAYRRLMEEYDKAMVKWRKWEDPLPLMQAGAARNAIRDAQVDGLRLLAWIAKYVEPGHDPLKTLVQFAAEAGMPVSSEETEWADTEEEEQT
jgi:hypothetical protein